MIRRKVTDSQLVSISRAVRGPLLEENVMLSVVDGKVLISPIDSGEATGPLCQKGRFDQYNRIHIPEQIMTAVGIHALVDIDVLENGCLLMKPTLESCMLCGSDHDLVLVKEDKYLCRDCMRAIFSRPKM